MKRAEVGSFLKEWRRRKKSERPGDVRDREERGSSGPDADGRRELHPRGPAAPVLLCILKTGPETPVRFPEQGELRAAPPAQSAGTGPAGGRACAERARPDLDLAVSAVASGGLRAPPALSLILFLILETLTVTSHNSERLPT